jgi:hypothetical protein
MPSRIEELEKLIRLTAVDLEQMRLELKALQFEEDLKDKGFDGEATEFSPKEDK